MMVQSVKSEREENSRLPTCPPSRRRRMLAAAALLALVVALPVLLTGGNALAQTPIDAEQFCMRTKQVRSAILAEVPGATATCTKADPDAVPPVDAVYLTNLTTEQLAGVWTLDFRDANLSRFADGDFDGLTGLKKLNLSKNWFRVSPADAGVPLSILGQLEELYIANNNLVSVGKITADYFRGLHNLRILNLERNNLKYDRSVKHLATGAFKNLTNLRILKIGSNRLLTLPKGMFEGLSNLEVLDMYSQRYEWPDIGFGTERLEAGIFEGLSNLKKLDLGYNAFGAASVDEKIFEGLSSLEVLDLRHNPLTVLPQSVLSLPSTVWIRTDSDVAYPSPPEDPPSTTAFPEVSIAAGPDSVPEGDPATFTLSRTDPAAALTVTVSVTESGAMLSGAPPETVAFGAGESARTLSVATDDDAVVEAASTVTAVVVATSGYRVAPGAASAEVEVEDDDAATFDVTVNPAEIAEGEASTVTVAITNGVTFAADQAIALEFTGSTAAKGADFVVSPETLTLVAGQGTVTATVTAVDDSGEESAETIAVAASHDGTRIGTATVTISANDAPANGLTASFKNLPETHDGSSEFTFQVEFSEDVGISYAVLRDDGFAVTKGDVTGARRINGRNDLWQITVEPDGRDDVTITLPGHRNCGTTGAVCTRGEDPRPLSNSPSATVAGPAAAVTPTVGISGGSGTEGDDSAIAFAVTLDSAGADTVTVDYATANGTADDDDYTATSGTLTFAAGTTSGTITVPIADDDVNEGDETFTVALSNASGATLGTAGATGTIRNRHVAPTASISGGGGKEGDDDAIAFAVTLDRAAAAAVTVDYATSDGSATAGDDYTAKSGTLSFAAGETGKTVSVPIGDDNENESDETFTVTLSNASGAVLGTASATGTIENRHVVPLTASFEQVPAEHDGTTFVFHVRFSEDPAVSYLVLREESFDVTGGKVDKARRKDGRDDLREIHVEPSGNGDVTVSLPPTTDCDAHGAICTAADRPLSNANAATVRAMAVLSVADAETTEGAGATLEFAVTLSRAASAAVTVGYATADGTAVAGTDYTSASGTLTFDPGETSRTVSVTVLDDTVDDDGETLTLTLSNPSGARLDDAEATGTINNADPVPLAWLARFGRTVATHVTDAVGERLRGSSGQDSHLTVGGYRLPLGQRAAAADTPAAEPDEPATDARGSALLQGVARLLGLGPGATPAGRGGTGTDPWLDAPAADPRLGRSQTVQPLRLREVLVGSSFRLTLGATDDAPARTPRLTAWGRVAATRFDGRDGTLSLDGDVLTGTVGVDSEWDRLLAGLAVAHSRGDGSFTMPGTAERGRGDLENTLTSLHPYLRYAVNDRLAVWGLLGYGWGQLELEMDTGETKETDTNLVMGAFGGRGILLPAAETGGFELATRTDAMLTRTTSDAVTSMESAEADAHRLRLVLEGSRGVTWAEGRSLTPTVEVGLRHDWGDAETGFGVELGGRMQYADPALGLTVEGAVRALLAHEDADYEEWGASGTLRLAPGADGQGLALTLSPTWGAASSGVDGLWSRQTTAGLAPQGTRQTPTGRVNAEIGYGVAAPFGTGLLTPYAGTTLSDGQDRTYRLGTRLHVTGGATPGLTLNLEGTRQEPAGPQPVNQGLRLQIEWGF